EKRTDKFLRILFSPFGFSLHSVRNLRTSICVIELIALRFAAGSHLSNRRHLLPRSRRYAGLLDSFLSCAFSIASPTEIVPAAGRARFTTKSMASVSVIWISSKRRNASQASANRVGVKLKPWAGAVAFSSKSEPGFALSFWASPKIHFLAS